MNVSDLVLKNINIPFKVSFKHASAERKITEGVLVKAVSDKGETGFGEGCPRQYVTSESLQTVVDFFNKNKSTLIENIKSIKDIKTWTEVNKTEIDKNPAAWCAIELALLDLLAKDQMQSIEQLLDLPEIDGNFYYSAILGDSELDIFSAQLQKYISLGFEDYKIKISGEFEKDKEKIGLMKDLHKSSIKVRIDANNLWKDIDEAIQYIKSLDYPFNAIEEPLKAGYYDELSRLSKECQIKIILDESFLKVDDFDHLEDSSNWIINLRISKMGGLIRSKKIAEKAYEKGIPIIIGAQVGETSILSRAALTIANANRNNLMAQEGAFGTLLLETDVCNPSLMFKEKGILVFSPQVKYGLQLDVIEQ